MIDINKILKPINTANPIYYITEVTNLTKERLDVSHK